MGGIGRTWRRLGALREPGRRANDHETKHAVPNEPVAALTPSAAQVQRMGRRQVEVVIGLLALITAVVGAVFQFQQGADSGHDRGELSGNVGHQEQGQGCEVVGDDADLNCSFAEGPEPSVRVVPGPKANTWALRIRNFEANSRVVVTLTDPAGNPQALGDGGERLVDSDGTADTADRHFFWRHKNDEPTGIYTVTVTGQDQNGEDEQKAVRFTIPAPPSS
jgi:hypothetical protein